MTTMRKRKRIACDIEANDLLFYGTEVYCICCTDIDTGEETNFSRGGLYGGRPIHEFPTWYKDSGVTDLIYHNGIGYDLPAQKKLLGWDYTIEPDTFLDQPCVHWDTMLLSKLLNPDRRGGHSLEAWGKRLGEYKDDYQGGFETYSKEMFDYCRQDAKVLSKIFFAIMKEFEGGDWNDSSSWQMEKLVYHYVTEQEQRGIKFDIKKAEDNWEFLEREMRAIEQRVEPHLPRRKIPESRQKRPPKKQFKKDGTPSALAVRFFGEPVEKKEDGKWYCGGTMLPNHDVPVEYENMHLSNQADIKKWLQQKGWKPTIWNYKKDPKTNRPMRSDRGKLIPTSPKFTDTFKNICPNLERMVNKSNNTMIKDIVLWLSYRNRRNVIKSDKGTGWLNNPRLQVDGRLPSGADTIGTNTGRFAHRIVANIPRVTSVFGTEMRQLFTTDTDNYLFIGWDAAGLEARMEAHYTFPYDNGEYARELLEGDIHSNNAKLFECDRSTAKSGKYCLTYGGQAAKLAETLGVSPQKGKELFENFWKGNVSLQQLKEQLTKFWETTGGKKWIKGLDGRKIMTRSKHSLVNALFQSAGIICMKRALVIMEDLADGYNANALIRYHDEEQWEVSRKLVKFKSFKTPEEAECFECPEGKVWGNVQEHDGKIFRAYSIIGELGVKSIREAGKYYNLNVPLDADYNVGLDWSMTH